MEETISPMFELSATRRRLDANTGGTARRRSTASTDYTDEFIQDFRLSVATPVLPVVGSEVSNIDQSTFIRVMQGHSDCVRTMALYIPPDGETALLVSGGDDGVAFIWDMETFRVVRKLEGVHTHRIRCVSIYSPDTDTKSNNNKNTDKKSGTSDLPRRAMVVTGSDDKTAAVWDLHSGELIRHLSGGHRWFIMGVTIVMPTYGSSPFVVTSGWDSYSVVWNVGTGKQVMQLSCDHANAVSSVVAFVSPQLQSELGRDLRESAKVPFILTVGFDKVVNIWDGESGQLLRSYTGKHTDIISCACVFTPPPSERGLYGLTGSFDHTAVSWNLLTGEVIRTLRGHTDWVTSVAMFRGNSGKPFFAMGLTGSNDGTAILWDLVYGLAIRKFKGVHQMPITGVRFLSRCYAQGSGSTNAYDTNLRNCEAYYRVITLGNTENNRDPFKADTEKTAADDRSNLNDLADPRNNKHALHFPYILTCSEDCKVVLWNLDSVQSEQLVKHSDLSATTSSAGSTGDSAMRGGNAPTTTSKDWIITMKVFAPEDGRRPVLVSGSTNSTATLWDLLSGRVIRELHGVHTADVSGVDVIETTCEKFLKLKKARNILGQKQHSLYPADQYYGDKQDLRPCTSNEGSVLLVLSGSYDCKAVVWDFDSGESLQVLSGGHTENISHIAASAPFGAVKHAFLVTCSYDISATIWNLHTGEILHKLNSVHTDGITSVTIFKPLNAQADTRPLVISAGIDGIAVVWDICSGSAVRTLSGGHTERIKSVTTYQPSSGGDAVVVTGGYDKRAIVWDLNNGSILRVLAGAHTNWVTAVSVVEPRDGGPVFVVTGGFDGNPILWDLASGKFICKLEGGHNNGIRAVGAYAGVPGEAGRYSPLIFSAGHDGYITKWDSLYPFHCMPPKATVRKLFELDKSETADKEWPRISALSERFGQPLWMENSDLFIQAVVLRRSDFLCKFQSMLGVMLGRLGEIVPGKTMLRYAIEHKDLQSTRIILKCWVRNLNMPITSTMMIKVHASMYLPLEEVLLLGRVFPAEFTDFIGALRLIPIDLNVCMCGLIDASTKSLTAGCTLANVIRPYELFDVNAYGTGESTRGQPVSLSYIPLQGAASVEMLQMYMQTAVALGSVEIFDTDVAVYALRFAWKHFGYKVHVVGICFYAAFFAVYTPNILLFEQLVISDDPGARGFGWFLQILTAFGILGRLYYVVAKVRALRGAEAYKLFVRDVWNLLDVASLSMAFLGLGARFVGAGENFTSRCVLSVTTILLWFKGLYFLRPFRISGPLVSMVLAIAYDIKVFLLIMAMALFGFSQGFWLISHRDPSLPFGTINQALLSSFNYMMGDFNTQFEGSVSPTLSTVLVVVFVIFMIVLMLNLLIALMGNTFAYVSEKGLAQWRQEQVSIILDEKFMLGTELQVPPCLYVLMNTTDYEEYGELRDLKAAQRAAQHRRSPVTSCADHVSTGGKSAAAAGAVENVVIDEKLAALETVVMDRVQQLENKLDGLVNKMDYIVSKLG